MARRRMEGWIVKNIQTAQMMILARKRDRSGFFPSPHFEIMSPHKINPRLRNPQSIPQVWTDTMESP